MKHLFWVGLLVMGCAGSNNAKVAPRADLPLANFSVHTFKFKAAQACSEQFVTHALEHTTTMRKGERLVYDSNGAGVAVADFDHNGYTDIVLGNLAGVSSIAWNLGGWRFEQQDLRSSLGIPLRETRAVQAIDLDADGWMDFVSINTRGAISAWLNQKNKKFVQTALEGVNIPAYTMLWTDFDQDGDLDLVTGSYNAQLEAENKDSFMLSSGAGVVVYTNTNNRFTATTLNKTAQTLAMTLFDTDGDGRRELIVGNDFFVPDYVYTFQNGSWKEQKPFARITKNTMGYAIGDLENDGRLELFATDMKPNFSDKKALAAWMPFMQKSFEKLQYNNIQRAENTLHHRVGDGFENIAYQLGLDATGWSWSAQFADFDRDGFEDLYVVNGMIDFENLKYLPKNELVEDNQAFKNTHGGFVPAPQWGMGSTASGRAMTIADFDNDGRVDVVINNLESAAQVLENRLCGGDGLQVRLQQPGQNPDAIGATVRLYTSLGVMTREIRSQNGYLSGSDTAVWFGLPKGSSIQQLEVIWSDNTRSLLKSVQVGQALTMTRQGGQP